MLNNISIKWKLIVGFSILIILVLFIGFFSYSKLMLLGKQTESIYHHPLTVIRSSLLASNYTQEIAILMKEMVGEADKNQVNRNKLAVDNLAKQLDEQLVIVEKQILGDEGNALIAEVQSRVQNWGSIRNEYIDAVLMGRLPSDEAREYRIELLSLMLSLSDYASINADGFFERAESTTKATLSLVLLMIGSTIVVATLSALYLIRSVIPPLNNLKETIVMIESESDLTQRISVQGQNEIGASAHAINSMLDKFQSSLTVVSEATSQLASTAEETSAITNQTSDAIQQQMSETSQVASAISELSASVDEVAGSASTAAATANTANGLVKAGLSSMSQTRGNIQELVNEIQNASGVIRALETDSEKIGAILDVIRGVAEQTNLLALNAAIEAARAGEHGRGFAVVADEVRNLASKTSSSTEEINQMIFSLQNSSKGAVDAMSSSQAKAADANTQAEETGGSLNAIATSITEINDMSIQIASAAEEQAAVTTEISNNVLRINDMSEESSRASSNTRQASVELTRLATDLQDMVAAFKLS